MQSPAAIPRSSLELWGGIECTVNRVGGQWYDQLELSGHASRIDDIDRIASLGIRTLRYPLLWERIAPELAGSENWSWADARMRRLKDHEIEPVVGLVHHGSGPSHTSLLDPGFAAKLAQYARSVAERYPHIRYVTPINEPLTTARFSTLYGHWFPHEKSAGAFATALLNQCVAIRRSFQTMREVIPGLQLVQTEDLGRVRCTPALQYQADFENERRWLTYDLLCGRVDETHPLWNYLAVDRHTRAMLHSLCDEPSSPHIIGVNYYVTSERFLDERHALYDAVGGNGRHLYADVDAVRALPDGIAGHAEILKEVWQRYRIPVALTEVHLGCTREHQMRWLHDAWTGAMEARASGADVRAVTAWALFGSFGWDSLVTRPPFNYESGAFDMRSGAPRETGLGRLIRTIASTGQATHPAADQPGWWRRAERLTSVAPFNGEVKLIVRRGSPASRGTKPRPLLITGARGTLGSAFMRICAERGIEARALDRSELDITDAKQVEQSLASLSPWALINAAGYVRVDDAEQQKAECYRSNTVGVGVLAAECSRAHIPLVTFSTDLVFDGRKGAPYVEGDAVSPINTYGASKAAAEVRALMLSDQCIVVRTSAFFGPWDEYNFITMALARLANGLPFMAASDVMVSPTYVPDLVNSSLDLLIDGETGIWHLANQGEVTWSDLARRVAERAGLSLDLVREMPSSEMPRQARIPLYTVLRSERCNLLPPLDDAIDRYMREAALPALASIEA